MSQLKRIYQSIKSANPRIDDGKARQQAWVIRDKMILENTAVSSSAAAGAAGAGGAGGGGGAGGARKRAIPTIEAVTGLSYIVTWVDPDTDTHKFFIFNHSTGTLSTTVDTELINDSGNEWVFSKIFAVQEKGFVIEFQNNTSSASKLYYVNFNGIIIDIKDLDTYREKSVTAHKHTSLGELNGSSYVYNFDGEKVNTYIFTDRPSDQIVISGDSAYYDWNKGEMSKNGIIVITDLQVDLIEGNETSYLALTDGTLLEVSDLVGEEKLLDFNNNFISALNAKNNINILSEEGTLLNTYDLTGKGIKNWSSSAYGENSVYYLLDDGITVEMVAYDGDLNQFSSFTFSLSESPFRPTYYSKKQWQSPIPSFGTTLTQVSINGGIFQSSQGRGYSGTVSNIWWLPKGQSTFLNHSLSDLGPVEFQDLSASSQITITFTEGSNPVVIFSTQSSPLYVGFLTDTGFVTQSTGINRGALAGDGVYGGKVGDYTFAGYNQNNVDITWQIYGGNSILETFTTSISVESSYKSNFQLDTSNLNGTLMILDTSENDSPSYVYTTEIGLQEVFLGYGTIYNNTTYGNRTGLASEFQIVTQETDSTDAFITGFYLLSKSGLSSLKDLTPLLEGDNHTVNSVSIGDSMVSFSLSGTSTAIIKEIFEFTNQTFKNFPPVAGTYQGVEASTDGSGTGLIFDVVVTGPDELVQFTITATLVDGGTGFLTGDGIYLDTQFLGGTGSETTSTYTLLKADIDGVYSRILTFNKSTLDIITNLKETLPAVYFYNDRVYIEKIDGGNTIITFLHPGGSNQTTINSDKGNYESNDSRDNSNV